MGVAEVGLRRQLGVEVLVEGEFAAVVEGDRSAGGFMGGISRRASSVVSACLLGSGAVNVKRVFLLQKVSRLPRSDRGSGLIAAPRQRIAAQLAAYRRG